MGLPRASGCRRRTSSQARTSKVPTGPPRRSTPAHAPWDPVTDQGSAMGLSPPQAAWPDAARDGASPAPGALCSLVGRAESLDRRSTRRSKKGSGACTAGWHGEGNLRTRDNRAGMAPRPVGRDQLPGLPHEPRDRIREELHGGTRNGGRPDGRRPSTRIRTPGDSTTHRHSPDLGGSRPGPQRELPPWTTESIVSIVTVPPVSLSPIWAFTSPVPPMTTLESS